MLLQWQNTGGSSVGIPSPNFAADLITSIVPRASGGDSTPTFTRAIEAYAIDFEGRLVLLPSGAARMQGTRIVQNLITGSSEDLTGAGWSSVAATTTVSTAISPPTGRTTISKIVGNGANAYHYANQTTSPTGTVINAADMHDAGAGYGALMFGGTNTGAIFDLVGGTVAAVGAGYSAWMESLGNGWYRCFVKRTIAGDANWFVLPTASVSFAGVLTSAQGIYVTGSTYESVTGQTNQNPSEYVSVGVASAPSYHGLGVDGIKSFDTLNGNTVDPTTHVVTEATGAPINSSTSKFAVLPGVSGSYFSTPDSVANSITGDIDIRARLVLYSAKNNAMVFKADASNTISYQFYTTAGGDLPRFTYSTDGTAAKVATSSAAWTTVIASGTEGWLRVTLVTATGKVNFYASLDGITWTLLGVEQSLTAGAIFNSTSSVQVGYSTLIGLIEAKNIYRAQIYNGINGTLAVDFNPNDSTSAQTWTSATTGEVWTTNGNARVFGNTHATYGIPAQWDASGPLGLLTEASEINKTLQSQTFQNAVWVTYNITPLDNQYVAPDGTTTVSRLTAVAGNTTRYIVQAADTPAGAYTQWCYLKYVNNRWALLRIYDGTVVYGASFDLLNGAAGAVTANTTSSITPTAVAGVYRVSVTATTLSAVSQQQLIAMQNADSATLLTWTAAGTEIMGVWNAQAVDSAIVSSPISTTTTAITRNADVEQYVSAGNLSATAMTIAMEITPSTALGSATAFHFGTCVDASNYTAILSDGTNLIARKRIAGANTDATVAFTRTVGTTVKAVARFDSTNGIDVWIGGTKGTGSATLTASQIGTNFQIGADGNGANQDYCMHRNFVVKLVSLSDAMCAAMST